MRYRYGRHISSKLATAIQHPSEELPVEHVLKFGVMLQKLQFSVDTREECIIRVSCVHGILCFMVVAHLKSESHEELHDVEEGLQRHTLFFRARVLSRVKV